MGTYWSPYDARAQEKYRRNKANAEVSASKKVVVERLDTAIGDSTGTQM